MVNVDIVFCIHKYIKKGEKVMGIFFAWFQCNDIEELEKERDKKLARSQELKEEAEAINEKIADLKGEN